MKPGELRRWRFPEHMPTMFNGTEIFMVIDAREIHDMIEFLINGNLVRSWSYDWVHKHSEPLNEIG